MANTKKHAATGAIIGLIGGTIANLIYQKKQAANDSNYQFDRNSLLLSAGGGALLGMVCGVIPDILEPAYHSHHRSVFHSIATFSAISYGLLKANESNLTPEEKATINIAGMSYLSHLLLDGETPRGLPLLFGKAA
jgi:membrane-bound metal-dependent hydrolase YbcI (DUF457 family)